VRARVWAGVGCRHGRLSPWICGKNKNGMKEGTKCNNENQKYMKVFFRVCGCRHGRLSSPWICGKNKNGMKEGTKCNNENQKYIKVFFRP
jgi:hypothetical protein